MAAFVDSSKHLARAWRECLTALAVVPMRVPLAVLLIFIPACIAPLFVI